jgi:hypothetical protein
VTRPLGTGCILSHQQRQNWKAPADVPEPVVEDPLKIWWKQQEWGAIRPKDPDRHRFGGD